MRILLSILFLFILSHPDSLFSNNMSLHNGKCSYKLNSLNRHGDDDPPEWVLKLKSSKYPSDLFITGVGIVKLTGNEANDIKNADNDAFSQIGKQISVSIKSETDIQSYEIIRNKESDFSEKTNYSLKVSTNIELQGLTIAERYFDKSKEIYYSLGIMDKKKSSLYLKQTIDNSDLTIKEQYINLSDNISSGSIKNALNNIKELIRQINIYNSSIPVYNIISAENRNNYQLLNHDKVNSIFTSILSNLKIEFISGDKQEILQDKALPEPLIFKLLADDKGKPASGLRISVKFIEGTGDLQSSYISDNSGLIYVNIIKPGGTERKKYTITAAIDLSEFIDTSHIFNNFNKSITDINISRLVTLKQTDIYGGAKVLIKLEERDLNHAMQDKIITSTLEKRLLENGMTPVYDDKENNCSLTITGSFRAVPYSELNGIKVSVANGFIKAERNDAGKLIAQENAVDIKGIGNNDEQAMYNALKKVSDKIIDSFINQIITGEYK